MTFVPLVLRLVLGTIFLMSAIPKMAYASSPSPDARVRPALRGVVLRDSTPRYICPAADQDYRLINSHSPWSCRAAMIASRSSTSLLAFCPPSSAPFVRAITLVMSHCAGLEFAVLGSCPTM